MHSSKKRVLLLEDDAADGSLLRGLLADIGAHNWDVERVQSVEAARAALSARSYDICLANENLVTGNEFSLFEPQNTGAPPLILLCNGQDDDIDLGIAATKAGAMDTLPKGQITAPLLARSIRYAIERAQHEAALEAALGQSRLLDTAVGNFTDGMVITDPRQADSPIIFANAAFCTMTGYALDEILGHNCRFLQGEGTDARTVGQIRESIEAQRPFRGVILNYRKDGTPFWNGLKITPVFDGEGQLTNFVGLQSDVTERLQVEIALRESEARKAAILEAALDGIVTIDHKNTVVEFNPAAEQIFGFSRAQAIGRSVDELLLVPVPRVGQQIESTGYHASGRRFPVELAVTRIKIEGKPLFTAYVRDISERKRAEVSLRQSEANLRAAQQVARLGSWELDLTAGSDSALSSLHWSDEVFRIFGYEPGQTEVSYENFLRAVHPDDQERVREAMARALGKDLSFGIDHRIVRPDGTERVVHEQADILRDPVCAAARRLVGTVQDITERKRAEERIAEQTRSIDLLLNSTGEGIFGIDSQHCCTFVNAAASQMVGYAPEELMGRDLHQLLHHTRADGSPYPVNECPISRTFENGASCRVEDEVFWRRDGSSFPVSYSSFPILENGAVTGAVVTCTDISERKAASQTMARLAAIVESSTDAIIGKTLDDTVISWNAGAEVLYGYTAREAMGRSVSSLIAPQCLGEPRELFDKIARGESVANYETVRVHKDGRHLEVSLTVSPIKDESGALIGASAIARDIGDRKRTEKALRDSEERFASIVTNVPGMVYQFILRPDGAVEWPFVSDGCREIYETEPETFKSDPLWPIERIHPDDRAGFQASVALSAETLLPWRWEGRHRLDSGRILWIQGASRPQRLLDGSTLWNGVVMDISARKEAEIERDRFFTMSLDMLGVAGLDGSFRRMNPAFSEILGFSEAELLAQSFLETVHPEDQALTRAALRNLSAENPVSSFENRCRTKSGSWRWLEWKSVAVMGEGVIYAAARDVTDRKAAEAALLRANDELEERVGARTEELERTNVALQFQIAEREGAEAKIRRQQEAVAELGRRALSDVELSTLLPGALALSAAVLDVDFGVLVEWLPGTQQAQIQATIGRPSHGLHSHIPVPPGSLTDYVLRADAPVIMADSRTETRFPVSPLMHEQGLRSMVALKIEAGDQAADGQPYGAMAVGSPRERAFSQDDVNFLQSVTNILATAIGRHKVESEIRQLNAQLSETNEQLRIENIERQMALGAMREATSGIEHAREEAEHSRANAEAANLAKSEFLSRMSHELRTPLNAILGFGQILDRQPLSPLQKESIGYILKGGRHLLALINEVLDIARVEAGRIELSLEPIGLGEIVAECCALVHPLANEREIQLDDNLPEITPYYALADRQRLKQVLINLLSNAIKYNRQAGRVSLSIREAPGEKIQLRVTDSGSGLTPQDLQKLFTPFERLSAADSTIEGTGLGLVLSQRLAASMGGTLSVESVTGQGSTFWVELPRAASPLQALAEIPSLPAPEVPRGTERAYTALCIEDNLSNIRLLEAVLESRPHVTLLTAVQGSIGLDLARQHQPDVILLDLHLPGLAGNEVLRQLQGAAATREIPVIVISADATPTRIEHLLEAGAAAYLTKPLDVDAFLKTLDEVLCPDEVTPE